MLLHCLVKAVIKSTAVPPPTPDPKPPHPPFCLNFQICLPLLANIVDKRLLCVRLKDGELFIHSGSESFGDGV